jgi:HSP20 family protein
MRQMTERRATRKSEVAPEHPGDEREGQNDLATTMATIRRTLGEAVGSGPLGFGLAQPWQALWRLAGTWTPLVDVEETDEEYVFEAEVPGAEREDIDVEVVGKQLSIKGRVKERTRTGSMRRSTRHTGAFEYRAAMPDDVDTRKIRASLANGLLSVHAPKTRGAPRRKIEVATQ